MRNVVIQSLSCVLWIVMAGFVVAGTVLATGPLGLFGFLIGPILGLIVGAAFTGMGFTLLAIEEHLRVIRGGSAELRERPSKPLSTEQLIYMAIVALGAVIFVAAITLTLLSET